MTSIQRNLALWAAAALAVGIAALMAATYAVAYSQINRVYDEELVNIAEAVNLGEDWRGPVRFRIPRPGFNLSVRAYDAAGNAYFETVDPAMPEDLPRAREPGFADVDTASGRWRLYTRVGPEGIVQVAQPDATRSALARNLALRTVLPELVFAPLFILFLAWVLRRGLAPLHEVSRRVRDRDASRMDPLPLSGVPVELRPLIEQINALLGRLAQAMDAQRRFVEDAAHELRTPVAALALQSQVAERAVQPAARAAAFWELRQGIARAARLVEQLLRLGELGPDAPRQFGPVDLAEVAREVVGALAYRARSQGVDLGAEAPGEALINGAGAELASLLSNLVDNALRYAPRGSEVTVHVRDDGARVRLAVVDAGPGIPADQRELVFERFRRAHGDETPGIGLGLAIARSIVGRHGGTLTLEDASPGSVPPGLAARADFPAYRR